VSDLPPGAHRAGPTIPVRAGDATADLAPGVTAIEALKHLDAIRGQIVAAAVTTAGERRAWDLDRPLPADEGEVLLEGILATSEEGRSILRHSTAHVLAQAVCDLFPGREVGHRPADRGRLLLRLRRRRPFTPDDLERSRPG
jgi:threonyl-tRNA synthetase